MLAPTLKMILFANHRRRKLPWATPPVERRTTQLAAEKITERLASDPTTFSRWRRYPTSDLSFRQWGPASRSL